MDAVTLKEILKREYGIMNEDEFNSVVANSKGVNIGIFTTPITERSINDKQKKEEKNIA